MTFSNCLRLIWRRLPFMMSQLASGFSSANLRSFFSPIRKYLDASSMESVYFCQIGISFVFKYSTSCKFARPLSEDGVAKNKRQKTDGCWHSSTGISPRPMLMGAAHDALRASNARVSLTCLYVIAHRLPHLFYGPVLSLSCLAGARPADLQQGHGAPADRLHADRSYPSALCCAGDLPPGFLCQGAITGRRVERRTRSARPWISSGQNPG